MSITLNQYLSLEAVIDNAQVSIGRRNVAQEIVMAGLKYDASFSITNTSGDNFNSDVIWATGDGGVTTFDYLYLEVDAAALVALQNGNSDSMVLSLIAGVPLILGADEYLDGALGADGSATTVADVIDQITVKNNTTGAAAGVVVTGRLVLFD